MEHESFHAEEMHKIGLNRPLKDYYNSNKGWTNELKKTFLELEERIKELRRLKERNAPESLIKEHVGDYNSGYIQYKKQFNFLKGKAKSIKKREFDIWQQEYFPNFKDIDLSTF